MYYLLRNSQRSFLFKPQLATPVAPQGRACHSFTTVPAGNVSVLFGGAAASVDQPIFFNDTWLFLANFTWVKLAVDGPKSRLGHAAAAVGDGVWIHGGSGLSMFNDVWVFNVTTRTWREIIQTSCGVLSPFVLWHAAEVLNNTVYIQGGKFGGSHF